MAKIGVGRRVRFTHMDHIHPDAVTELYSYIQASLPLLLFVLLTSKTYLQNCFETTVQLQQYYNFYSAHKLLFYQKGQTRLELGTEICSLATLCSPGLLCYSHRHLIPAVAPASLSGSISAVHEAGWHPGMAPGCTVLHTPASAHPAHQASYPPTITA